ncbi:trans-cinnamate:CoA ligase, peroxisomal-like [Andrographis paniculata]|uniref:trans-cinnamate:CoA ligase, peroxisomal-like n=1 Tax=Andrographis paniculata TaxID=175694 RepID=UPI0021E7CBA8|nr:trans-cinnamate:CoA ligase, peroxisomal-like [Andrographis paniculata]
MEKLPKCGANYAPLSPTTFLKRAAAVYGDRPSLIYGQNVRFTWRATYLRCRRLAAALRSFNIQKNDVVSVLAPNIPAMYEMHFAVPMAGAVLNTINTRLDAKNIAAILTHSEAKIFFVDYQYVPLARDALKIVLQTAAAMPLVVVVDDLDRPTGVRLGALEYEEILAAGNPNEAPIEIDDEWDPIALNYTSGTTAAPKGVVYSHRGAYLSTMSLIVGWEMKTEAVYLWSLPMFHCNGWTFTWGVAARGGTNVCIRSTTAPEIYAAIAAHGVTHMCCAPIVFNILLESNPQKLKSPVEILTGGAPPPAALMDRIEALGFHVVHAYGLTEATGPALVCEWQKKWNNLSTEEKSRYKARQGISILTLADVDVKNPATMESVARDGEMIGEIALRGSSIMKGYFKDEEATGKVFRQGWFMTGDVGVIHSDGYVEIKDRSKDVIISGGENISSVEVEGALYKHPAVVEAAVVAMPHAKWGESPCAFVKVKAAVTAEELLLHCRRNLPSFMVPKRVEFMAELPKTATGKIQKFELRAVAKTFDDSPSPAKSRNDREEVQRRRYSDGDEGQSQEHVLAMSRL